RNLAGPASARTDSRTCRHRDRGGLCVTTGAPKRAIGQAWHHTLRTRVAKQKSSVRRLVLRSRSEKLSSKLPDTTISAKHTGIGEARYRRADRLIARRWRSFRPSCAWRL